MSFCAKKGHIFQFQHWFKEIPVKVEDLVHQKEDLAKTAKTVIEQANEEAEHAATVKKQAEELLK